MILKGALEIVPDPGPGFYSRLFLVEKASGGWTPVIDLSPPLNEFVRQTPFKMETTASVLLSVRKGDFLASVDLKDDVYFQIPIHHSSRKLLRFATDGTVHQFKVLCFGLSTATQIFTRDFAAVSAWAHSRGVRLPISGRLVGPGLLGDQSQAALPRSTLALSLPRHSGKRKEVRPQPVPVCGVPRYVHRQQWSPEPSPQ